MISCPVCADAGSVESLWHLSFGEIVKCHHCSVVTMRDFKGDLPKQDYSFEYYSGGMCDAGYSDYFGGERAERELVARSMARALVASTGRSKGRRLLDFGCGGGFFVEACGREGFEAFGVDISEPAIRWAKNHQSSPARYNVVTDIDELRASGRESFDIVTLIDVLEHVPDPVRLLRGARRILAPGGALLVVTPRYGGRFSRIQGNLYIQFKLDHIFHFTPDTLIDVVERGGFDSWDVADMTGFLMRDATCPTTVINKYRRRREHMIAICSAGADRAE